MITREKSRGIPGSYRVVFEACVRAVESFEPDQELQSIMGTTHSLRIQSAQAKAGTIIATAGDTWRVEIRVLQDAGECQVALKLIASAQRADPFGIMFRWIETFLEVLEQIAQTILLRSRKR
jgi:hypothetical protein